MLLLHPRVQANLFPFIRESQLHTFISASHSAQAIDPQSFWQLRDLYGSGSFQLFSDHTIYRESQQIVAAPRTQIQAFAIYQGKRVFSYEYLIPKAYSDHGSEVLDQITQKIIPPERLIFKNEKGRIFFSDSNTLTVAFITSFSEVAKANGLVSLGAAELRDLGLFDYANVTSFTLDCCSGFEHEFAESSHPRP